MAQRCSFWPWCFYFQSSFFPSTSVVLYIKKDPTCFSDLTKIGHLSRSRWTKLKSNPSPNPTSTPSACWAGTLWLSHIPTAPVGAHKAFKETLTKFNSPHSFSKTPRPREISPWSQTQASHYWFFAEPQVNQVLGDFNCSNLENLCSIREVNG